MLLLPVADPLVVTVQVAHKALVFGTLVGAVRARGLEGCGELVGGVVVMLFGQRREDGRRVWGSGLCVERSVSELVSVVSEGFGYMVLIQTAEEHYNKHGEEHIVERYVEIGHLVRERRSGVSF